MRVVFMGTPDFAVGTLKAIIEAGHDVAAVLRRAKMWSATDLSAALSGADPMKAIGDLVAQFWARDMQKEKRTDNKAVLEVAGRDQQDQKLWLNFNRERCVWELTKTETELWKEPEDPVLEKIKELVTETTPEWAGTATELVEVLQVEMQPNALSRKLNVSLERLILEYGIQYKTERGHDGRKIRLTFVGKQA